MRRIACLLALVALTSATAMAGTFGPPRSRGGNTTPPSAFGDLVWFPNGASADVWDYSDPSQPVLSRVDLTSALDGPIFSSTIVGNALCIGWANGLHIGVRIFSLADPLHPAFASDIALDEADRVASDGTRLYVLPESGGIAIYDVTDPAHPLALSSVAARTYGGDVRFAAGRVYTTDPGNMVPALYLTIYDVSDPAHPAVLVDGVNLRDSIGGIDAIGDPTDDGFVPASNDDGFSMLDARDPDAIDDIFDDASGRSFQDARRDGTTLYVAAENEIETWDVSQPTTPQHLADTATPDSVYMRGLLPFDDGLLATTDDSKALVYDTTAASLGAPLSSIDVPSYFGGPLHGVRDDAHVYTQAFGGFQVLDPTTLEPVGSFAPGSAENALLGNNVELSIVDATVFSIGSKLVAIDVSDPTTPRIAGTLDIVGSGVADGNRAYLHDSSAKTVTVVDIGDPTSMQVAGVLQADLEVYAARGGIAFGLDLFGTTPESQLALSVIDATDATRPRIASSFPVCGPSSSVSSLAASDDGNDVAIVCGSNVVEIYNVLNPGSTTPVATLSGPVSAIGWKGTHLYLGADAATQGYDGVDVYDVSQLASPQLVAHVDIPDDVQSLSLSPNGSLLASMQYTGMAVADCVASSADECGATTATGVGHSHHARPSESYARVR
jgi:hypothetical protein